MFRNLKKLIGRIFLSEGFAKDGGGWIFVGRDSVVKCTLQKSSYDGQCWLNVTITDQLPDLGPSGMAAFRLEILFPDKRDTLLDLLNLDRRDIGETNIEMLLSQTCIPTLKSLTQISTFKYFYDKHIEKGGLIDRNLRVKMLAIS